MSGYHLGKIEKGHLGLSSKIREELDELQVAERQNCVVMAMLEASDIYGALRWWAKRHNLTMRDLEIMSDITEHAFISGKRKSKHDDD